MAYKYSETRKHILTPELVIHDIKEDNKKGKVMAPFLLVVPPGFALLFTALTSLVTDTRGTIVGGIICGLVWLSTLMVMGVGVMMLVSSRKTLTPADIHIVKRTLDTISYDEPHRTGRHTFYHDVFYFTGMDKFYPTSTESALAEEGDEYYIVTRTEGGTHPIRIYRADTYIWIEPEET